MEIPYITIHIVRGVGHRGVGARSFFLILPRAFSVSRGFPKSISWSSWSAAVSPMYEQIASWDFFTG